tara:strand:+ start:389 stop:1135 length:747 start_codon:yes stop_codon:yes gene_type:complete
MFIDKLNITFADYITNGVIECEPTVFKNGLDEILQTYSHNEPVVKKRSASKFMIWLKSKRDSIKEEYFNDFDMYNDWTKEGTLNYYKSKDLPLEKLEILIIKKEKNGKTTFKPRLLSLITTKAGQLWTSLDGDIKNSFNTDGPGVVPNAGYGDDKSNANNEPVIPTRNKKKGRPKGTHPKNSVSETAIMDNLQMLNTLNNIDEEIEINVDEFEYNGVNYYKDEYNNVYSFGECKKIGTFNKGEMELFE